MAFQCLVEAFDQFTDLRLLCTQCAVLLVAAGSGVATLGIPGSPGVPAEVVAHIRARLRRGPIEAQTGEGVDFLDHRQHRAGLGPRGRWAAVEAARHPRVVPEAAMLASLAMNNVGLKPDVIIDVATLTGQGTVALEFLEDAEIEPETEVTVRVMGPDGVLGSVRNARTSAGRAGRIELVTASPGADEHLLGDVVGGVGTERLAAQAVHQRAVRLVDLAQLGPAGRGVDGTRP